MRSTVFPVFSFLCCLLSLLVVACDGDDPSDGTDASMQDAGSREDAGNAPDDAGPPMDASDASPPDGGASENDGSVSADADVSQDGGLDLDRVIAALRTHWCEPWARVRCSAPWDCGCETSERPDPTTCVPAEVDECMAELASVIPEIERGFVRVDEAALAQCGMRLEAGIGACAATGDDIRNWCEARFIVDIDVDESCAGIDGLCAGGTGTCSTGTCIAFSQADDACVTYNDRCPPGMTCRSSFGASRCVPQSGPNEACTRESDCAAGLVCAGGVCKTARVSAGGACTKTGECAAGLVCVDGECAEAGASMCEADADCPSLATCRLSYGNRCVERRGLGEACSSTNECPEGAYCDFTTSICTPGAGMGASCSAAICAPGLFCRSDLGNTCQGPSALGEPCYPDSSRGENGCQEGLACVWNPEANMNVCTIPSGVGGPCGQLFECAEGLACLVNPSTFANECGLPGTEGNPCLAGVGRNVCQDHLFCDTSTSPATCRRRRVLGEICTDDLACVDGLLCLDDGAGTRTCRTPPGLGEACSGTCSDGLGCAWTGYDGQCRPSLCNDFTLPL